MEGSKDNIKSYLIKILFIIASIIFAIPSCIYLLENKTVLEFGPYFQFLYNFQTSRLTQTFIYIIILLLLTLAYFLTMKNREKMFKNIKRMFIFISIISIIFMAVYHLCVQMYFII